MKNLPGLLAFVETVDCGTLAAAAERLELTPAAVSKALSRLEAQLGVRLLQRSTRRLSLTAEGEAFLSKARAALRLLDEAVAEVAQSAREPAGRVRISVGMAFGRRWVLPLLPALTAAHPQLAIDVDLENRQVDLVAGGFDIAVRGGFIEDSSLVARRVCALPVVLLASPGYLRRAGIPATPADLSAHRCAGARLGASATPQHWRFVGLGGRRLDVLPQPALTTTDPETLVDLALAGAGIVQAGLHHALPSLRSGRLKLLFPGLHDAGTREIVVHYPHRLYLAPRVRVVVDALLAGFAASPDLHLGVADVVAALPEALATPVLPGGGGRPGARPNLAPRRTRSPRR
jgi:DNA-binding transcriptional LysR family regulator